MTNRIVDGSTFAGRQFNPFKMRAYLNGAQSVAKNTVGVLVNFDTASYDTYGDAGVTAGFSPTNHNYLVPVAGYYQINACVGFTMPADANVTQDWYAFIYVNAAQTQRGVRGIWTEGGIGVGFQVEASVNDSMALNTGDAVDIRVYVSTTTTPIPLATGSINTYWSMHLLSI